MKPKERELLEHLVFLYGEKEAPKIFRQVMDLLEYFHQNNPELTSPNPKGMISEKDVVLITYGDMVQQEGETPLDTLGQFLKHYLSEVISTIHILPFYPYSSDDGFSVIDYRQVNKNLGNWEDISKLNQDFRLMFDAVVNHVSAQSVMFQSFLKGDTNFEEFFTIIEPGIDLSRVFRPRATPVLTPFDTPDGEKLVWTTFSADQIDLNYRNPAVLLEIIEIILFYAERGAEFIRLDAVTFVWKEIGTPSINLPQTHRIVQLLRTILDIVAPFVAIITETNVPHIDNIAYFGNGTNEAQMVYNFALPLLTLNSFLTEDVTTLSKWADTLDLPSDQATFFNFLAGHDGIGILPTTSILSSDELEKIIDQVNSIGGKVSYKSNEDGSKSPYELNINYLDALNDPEQPEDNLQILSERFLASQAIMLALRGVPGIYFHSIFGSRNWIEGVETTGRYRTINREKLDLKPLQAELDDPDSLRARIYQGYYHLLSIRKQNSVFHPYGGQKILNLHPKIFSLFRTSPDGQSQMLCLHNVTNQSLDLVVNVSELFWGDVCTLQNVVTGQQISATGNQLNLHINPYEIFWLKN